LFTIARQKIATAKRVLPKVTICIVPPNSHLALRKKVHDILKTKNRRSQIALLTKRFFAEKSISANIPEQGNRQGHFILKCFQKSLCAIHNLSVDHQIFEDI
jgi:hypothetical protein